MKYLLYRSLMAMMMLNHDNKDIDYSNKYFTIHALSDGDMILYTPSSYTSGSLAYSINDGDWVSFNSDTTLSLAIEDRLKIKCITDVYKRRTINTLFNFTGEYEVYGNVMSLLYGDDFQGQTVLTTRESLKGLFYQETTLKSAKNLILPATTLADFCYERMFYDCSSLTEAPVLPALTLADNCYAGMFYGCSSLTEAPVLPAPRLVYECYFKMFMECSSLNKIVMLATDISASDCLFDWVYRVASSGTFIKSGIEIPIGSDGIPNGWTSQVVTPSISNTLSTPIDFNYNEGMFTPTLTVELTKIMSEENILSLQPMCDITINVINKNNSLHTGDYLWVNNKTLSDVMQELNISNINNIAIVIVDADTPEDNGDYYYGVEKNIHIPISFSNNIQCSINGSDWRWLNGNTVLTNEETEPFVDGNYFAIETDEGDIYKFKGNLTPTSSNGIGKFTISKKCNIKGNVMSLLYRDNFEGQTVLTGKNYAFYKLFYNCAKIVDASELILPATLLSDYCYYSMFQGCTGLTTAPALPATTLVEFCYYSMFNGCKGLTTAPALIATTLAYGCCSDMFSGCTGLTTAPALPVTTLATECYSYMFSGCTGLNSAPELPATTLASNCYSYIFSGCTGLTIAPSLPATTLANYCYSYMFDGCTSLTTAPELPATTLAEFCYTGMFSGCTGLTESPALPVTTLANGCYGSMFYGCNSLTTAPELPASTLAKYCYYNMFYGCNSLTTAPELPVTTLAENCYRSMFYGCKNLTTAPELPATTLVENCYWSMFYGCSKLNNITMLATDISASGCLSNWVYGVASSGTFIKNASMTSLPRGIKGIPNDWRVVNYGEIDYFAEYFTIEALEDGLTVKLSQNASQYRIDDGEWVSLSSNTITPSIDTGQKISFKNTNPTISSSYGIGRFTVNKAFNVGGNIMSLLYGDNFEGQIDLTGKDYAFRELLEYCTTLQNAENLILPATTLAYSCYFSMFQGCTSLTSAPALPATTLADYCYRSMFNGCKGLTTAPELPATTLADNCYFGMFFNCSSLTTVPALPATTLVECCYDSMFYGCTSLTTAPELPATTLAIRCYFSMFYGCTSLTTAPSLPATTLANYCYSYMFDGCTSLTKAPDLPATTLAEGCYQYMFSATNIIFAPVLPATTLANRCYYYMFDGCSKLINITMLATDISANICLDHWVNGVASNGFFRKNALMTSLPRGINGIPNDWTVIDYSA